MLERRARVCLFRSLVPGRWPYSSGWTMPMFLLAALIELSGILKKKKVMKLAGGLRGPGGVGGRE